MDQSEARNRTRESIELKQERKKKEGTKMDRMSVRTHFIDSFVFMIPKRMRRVLLVDSLVRVHHREGQARVVQSVAKGRIERISAGIIAV